MKTALFLLVILSSAYAGGSDPSKDLSDAWQSLVSPLAGCDAQCKATCCRNGGGAACVSACGCSGSCPETVETACDAQCKATCCRNGGGAACVSACGCSGSCPETVETACDAQCKA